jgi:hypothetical protein
MQKSNVKYQNCGATSRAVFESIAEGDSDILDPSTSLGTSFDF